MVKGKEGIVVLGTGGVAWLGFWIFCSTVVYSNTAFVNDVVAPHLQQEETKND